MNNFFLLNEALETADLSTFDNGISNLNQIVLNHDSKRDNLLKHSSVLYHHTKLGYINDILISSTKGKLFWKIYSSIHEYQNYIGSEAIFETAFPNQCNGFLGFDFNSTSISKPNQILTLEDFITFRDNCLTKFGQESIEDFWRNREIHFKGLIFCDSIFDYLNQFSVDDDRFLLIKEKLKRLNEFAINWNANEFPHYSMGISVNPDTKARLKKCSATRIYNCPDGDNRLFSWHIKLSVKTEYRIYYFPDAATHKVIVGVIGTKPELGF